MKKTDLSYFAGLFDGEGCIGIRRSNYRKGRYTALCLVCTVGMANLWMLESLKFAFGGGVYPTKKKQTQHKDLWEWTISSRQALAFLEAVLPYLKLKRAEAEVAINFQKAKINREHCGRRGLAKGERIIEEAQKIVLQELKRK